MRSQIHLMVVIAYAVISVAGWAGNGAGNSGHLVVCRDQQRQTMTLLDFFEATELPPFRRISLGERSLGIPDKIEIMSKRLERLDSELASSLRKSGAQLLGGSRTRWVHGLDFPHIDDTGYVPIPPECWIQQAVIQKAPVTKLQALYTIDADLWDRLDNNQRAGLVAHEVLYRQAIRRGRTDSLKVRRFVALLASPDMETISRSDYETQKAEILEPPRTPSFNTQEVDRILFVGQPFELDLRSLLASGHSSYLKWGSLEPLPPWLKLESAGGKLMGTPSNDEIGPLHFNLTVTDGINGAVVPVAIEVTEPGHLPPQWVLNELVLSRPATAAREYTFDLKSLAVSAEGAHPLFYLLLGPEWLHCSRDGVVTGVPPATQSGWNNWTVLLRTDDDVATATLKIRVEK